MSPAKAVRRLCRHDAGVIDGLTGEVIAAQLFVAALGASSYTYAEATWTQGLADWIGSHTRAFAFVGGVTAMVVSDNLKSGITKACFYEPVVNRSYAEMAAHYDTAIVPARPSVSSILKTNRDRQRSAVAPDWPAIVHSNIRGPPLLPLRRTSTMLTRPTIDQLRRAASAGQGPRSRPRRMAGAAA